MSAEISADEEKSKPAEGVEPEKAALRYGRTAGLLTVGVGLTGIATYLFFALASHDLSKNDYGEIAVAWSAVFITVSTLYRPIEQLLSRTIAERRARDQHIGQPIRVAATIQLSLAAAFAVVALIFRDPIENNLLSGNTTLYWILVGSVLAYAASFFARGYFAGSRRFGLYAGLLMAESLSRVVFAVLATIGITNGQDAIAIGIVAAPCFSLIVVPLAFGSRAARQPRVREVREKEERGELSAGPQFTFAHGGGFAAAVLLIMFGEQTLVNAGPLLIKHKPEVGAAGAGYIFNVLMIARAPMVLFQAISTSLLPHLTNLRSKGPKSGEDAYRLSVRITIGAVVVFSGVTLLVTAVAGPELMQIFFGSKFDYDRAQLMVVAGGMGFYLAAVTLNQSALARGQVRYSAAFWMTAAVGFVVWVLMPVVDPYMRVCTGFAGAGFFLCIATFVLYRRPGLGRPGDVIEPGSEQEVEARIAALDEAG
jgi:O-antigen/teichoic acid export membrane protein